MSVHRRLAALLLAVVVPLQSCVTMTPTQERYYALYLTDPDRVVVSAEQHEPALMTVLSFLVPGLGHILMGEDGWGMALCLGSLLLFWPWACIAAAVDTPTVNRANIADAYRMIYESRHAPPPAARGGRLRPGAHVTAENWRELQGQGEERVDAPVAASEADTR